MPLDLDDLELPGSGGNDGGEPQNRLALNLIRLVAAGFFIMGLLDLLAYWYKCRKESLELNAWHCVYLSIPLVIGVAILIKSSALAARVDEYLDE